MSMVDLSTLTIEPVLPQPPTRAWQDVLAEDMEAGEEFEQVHEALLHSLGNLTLTGYNSTLGNSPFAEKRLKLAGSGVRMNQEIAEQERWGRPQIQERADALAKRVIAERPGPNTHEDDSPETAWDVMNQALAELPAGAWTTYGDLAALIGSHAVAIGQRLATVTAPNAHRVLQSNGKVSPNSAWPDPAHTDDPRELLAAEGVTFDQRGRADKAQRVTTEGLAVLIGADVPDPVPELDQGQDPALRDRFLEQLAERQGQDIDGVDLPAAKFDLRPGFDLGVLLDAPAREQIIEVLGWFHAVASDGQLADSDVSWRARRACRDKVTFEGRQFESGATSPEECPRR